MLAAEVEDFVDQHRSIQTQDNKTAVVRNCYPPEPTLQTRLSDVAVKVPKAMQPKARQTCIIYGKLKCWFSMTTQQKHGTDYKGYKWTFSQ